MQGDDSCVSSVGMEGHRLFRKDRQRRRGGGVSLHVNDPMECTELCLGMDEGPSESLQVRIKGRARTGDIIVRVCYRLPDQQGQGMRPSTDREEQPHIQKPWSSWGTSNVLTSVVGAVQQGTGNPGGS